MQSHRFKLNNTLFFCLLAAIIGLGIVRLAYTWYAVSATYDEPDHIAAGLEWWSGSYTRDLTHPPLTRIAVSLGPLLRGSRFEPLAPAEEERNNSLYSTGYEDTLASARAPVALFFALTVLGSFGISRFLWGNAAGLLSAGLVSMVPVVLGHSALATTDAGLMAFLTLAFYAWLRFMDDYSSNGASKQTWKWAAAAGIFFGLAAACKLTSFLFFGPPALALFLVIRPRPWRFLPAIALLSLTVLWASYGFERSPLGDLGHLHRDHPSLRPFLETPVPLAKFAWSISDTLRWSKFGHTSYLLGEVSRDGWWYFFPIVLALKTPIPLLLLALGGIVLSLRQWFTDRQQQRALQAAPAIIALLILAVCLPARINLGARHILPIYPMLAILAAPALLALWQRSRVIAAIPVLWLAVNSVQAQPSYFDWFNELAGSHPERYLGESDLDWGQDLHRLRDALREEQAGEVYIAYFGSANLDRHGLPPVHSIDPEQPPPPGSWVAVSMHELLWYSERYRFLPADYRPIGRSIRLYRVDKPS